MNFITKVFAVLLIPLLALNLFLPQISSAYEGSVVADAKTTRAQPEVLATPEEDIPVEKIEKGGVRWYWIVLGAGSYRRCCSRSRWWWREQQPQ